MTTSSNEDSRRPLTTATRTTTSLQQSEEEVRRNAHHNPISLFLQNAFSSLGIFVLHLISLETVLSTTLSICLTLYTYYATQDTISFNGTAMDFVLLSFAIITPMSASIGITFSRREQGLDHISTIRATMLELYIAHACWDWRKADKANSGRAGTSLDSLQHSDEVLVEMIGIGKELGRFLTLPNYSRARHRIMPNGRREAAATLKVAFRLFDLILRRMGRLSKYCEVLKQEGLPPNEATRLRQWERMVVERLEKLRMLKHYRSPQALRSFARLFSVLFPPFYAPYYAELAHELNSLAVGILFCVFTSLALTALFESIALIEDPFALELDGIEVEQEMTVLYCHQLLAMRQELFEEAEPFAGYVESCEDKGYVILKPRILTQE